MILWLSRAFISPSCSCSVLEGPWEAFLALLQGRAAVPVINHQSQVRCSVPGRFSSAEQCHRHEGRQKNSMVVL